MQEMTIQMDGISLSPMRIAQGLTLDEARDLLDWLEANGVDNPELDIEDVGDFTVRWPE